VRANYSPSPLPKRLVDEVSLPSADRLLDDVEFEKRWPEMLGALLKR
jgi:hypothetical protein